MQSSVRLGPARLGSAQLKKFSVMLVLNIYIYIHTYIYTILYLLPLC